MAFPRPTRAQGSPTCLMARPQETYTIPGKQRAGYRLPCIGYPRLSQRHIFVGIALDVLAVILGIIALIQNNKKKGLPVAGMIVAVLSILLTFLFYYVMAMDKDASVRGIKDADRYLPTAEEKAASSELMENIVQQDYAASRNLILIYENKIRRTYSWKLPLLIMMK